MRILALDTATFTASVAVLEDGVARASGDVRVDTHSERLLPLVEEVLQGAGLTPKDLDAVACGQGPGSFTGLRIGLATAKGLCYALRRPLVMISSLAALATGAADEAMRRGARVLAVLDARRHEVFAGCFEPDGTAAGPELVVAPERLAEAISERGLVIVGDGAAVYPADVARCGAILAEVRPTPDARAIGALAARRLAAGSFDDLTLAAPTYLRPPVG